MVRLVPALTAALSVSASIGAWSTAARAEERPAAAKESAIVLPLTVTANVATEDQREELEDDAASMLSRYRRVDAVTLRDVKQMMNLEAQRAEIGCDTEGCSTEIVSALGARWVIAGRVERAPDGVALSLVLFDGTNARVVDRARVRGPELSDLRVQLAFAVDKVAASLRSPGDPSPGALLDQIRPKLAMLPLKMTAPTRDVDLSLARAGRRAARRLGLSLVDAEAFAALAKGAGCAPRDIGCALPAATAQGATLGLGVSVVGNAPLSVRATLLTPDGVVAAHAERSAADESDVPDAVLAVVDAVVRRDRGDPEDASLPLGRVTPPERGANAAHAAQPSISSPPTPPPTPLASWPPDAAHERERLELPCVAARGRESIGSRCTVTDRRLHIEHLTGAEAGEDIALADVVRVERTANLGVLPTGVRSALRDGSTLDLVVAASRRDEVVRDLGSPAPDTRSDP